MGIPLGQQAVKYLVESMESDLFCVRERRRWDGYREAV